MRPGLQDVRAVKRDGGGPGRGTSRTRQTEVLGNHPILDLETGKCL